jgi:hypothetical protein
VSRTVTIDGESYTLPTVGEKGWLADLNTLLMAFADKVNALDSEAHPAGVLYFGASEIVSGGLGILYPGYVHAAADFIGTDYRLVIPRDGTLSRLYAHHASSTSQAVTYTVRVNGSPTALTCEIAGGATSANLTEGTVAVNAGDRVSISVQASSTSPTAILPTASVLFTPTDPSS